MIGRIALAAGALALWTAQPVPSAAEVSARAAAWLADYEARLSALVAEEDYTQKIAMLTVGTAPLRPGETRRLVSDFMLVRLKDDEPWMPFRDVISVDGKPVRDRDARLERLFLRADAETLRHAAEISAESARYNLGRLRRTVNVPVLALEYLRPANAARCRFEGPHRDRLDGEEAWKIEFKERTDGRTVIRDGRNDRNVPAAGTFWIRASDAAVLRTVVKVGNAVTHSEIDVRYCETPAVPVPVPCRMSEQYWTRGEQISGTATYTNIRKFTVTTSESIKDRP
jgi:hypothetical protein